MDDDVGLQKAIYSSLQSKRTQDAFNRFSRNAPSHGTVRSFPRNGKRNALLREGIMPTVPRSQQVRSTTGWTFSQFGDYTDRPPWVNPLDEESCIPNMPVRLQQPSDRVPGWTLMCSGGRIQRQNAMGSNILFICEEVHYAQNTKIHCNDLLALRTVAPLPQGKNIACFTAQIQSLVSQGRYAMFGMGITPRAGDERQGFCVALVHYDSSGGIFLSVEKWRMTEQDTFERLELLEPMKTLRLIRERVTITLLVSSEHFSLSINGEVVCPTLHAPGVRLGESLPILLATGGKISVREVAVVEGHKPPANKLYGRPPPFTLSPKKSDTNKKGIPIVEEEPLCSSGKAAFPDKVSNRKGKVADKAVPKDKVLNSVAPCAPPGIAPELLERIEAEIIERSPNVEWDDIAGIPEAKRLLKEAIILPLLVPELFTGVVQPWKGVLLFGPPGTGKTMLARAVATSAKTTFFNISASSLISKYFGESEKIVRSLFHLARHYAPSTIFFDEVDALMSARGGNEHEASRRIKSEMLQQFDGLCTENDKRVLVLATTNRPWDLDEAMRRRLEKRIYIPLPDKAGRLSLLKKQTATLSLDPSVDLEEISDKRTEGFSGADMNLVVRDAAMMPMRRLIADRSPAEIAAMKEGGKMIVSPVTMNDFEDALKKIQPSVSQSSIKQFEKWAEELGSV
ncbi:katanin, putative [Trypanosoma equiperdum]|uniref:Katanin p60 ATPase-containing subunit A1 n=3 Tax=Trypanozoon TaxID=39700 RepID=D0A194_TRYB9|nr:katanin, putative [Trypanosoma brucei gambiense DAL972]RHW69291.1 katanin [Trypanosoma brucei equiperdum]CBH15036.1 katanin, putative [Trypanosoma brucei gambiense DAL972]SCU72165.1 katanin, putative [Trypanosoma equiperdum]|eukprot:XP_011777302.1 katanin, putative [Trypanosoma brucei gambiense DAL972]